MSIAEELVKGTTVTLPDGRLLRFTVTPDYDTSINDSDCYGRVEQVMNDRDLGLPKERPAGFDGAAEKISCYSGGTFWWQPPIGHYGIPRDQWASDPELRQKTRSIVKDILEFGFSVFNLELCSGTDAYGKPIVVDYTSISGFEPLLSFEDSVWIVEDMLAEILPALQETT